MEYRNTEPTNEELQKEISQLHKELDFYKEAEQKAEQSKKRKWKIKYFFVKSGLNAYLGKNLADSADDFFEEFSNPEKSIQAKTLSRLTIHVFTRFVRVGVIAFLLANFVIIVQTILISQQNRLLNRQNEKIDKQNIRLDQQTNLLEADRRSAVIFESGNVLDAISRELKQRKDSSLSDPLIGRIISLSRAMKEYKYLDPEADTLIGEAISPERGHLLVSLYNSRLDFTTYLRINGGANFSKAELWDAKLRGADLRDAELRGANLRDADLRDADLQIAKLQGADLRDAELEGADLIGASLMDAKLQGADLRDAELFRAYLMGVDLRDADLRDADLRDAYLMGADLQGADLQGADLQGADLSDAQANTIQIPNFLKANADTTGMIWVEEKQTNEK